MNVPSNELTKAREYAMRFPSATIKTTGFSVMVVTEQGKIIVSDKPYGKPVLSLISKVKGEARKAKVDVPDDYKPILYAARSEAMNLTTDVYCYDKNAAYANAALRLGIISKATFERLLKMPKEFRLSILGSIGTRKLCEQYEDGKRVKVYYEQDLELRKRWHAITQAVSEEMVDVFLRTESAAMWIDAVYSLEPLELGNGWKQDKVNADLQSDGKMFRMSVDNEKGERQTHLYFPTLNERVKMA